MDTFELSRCRRFSGAAVCSRQDAILKAKVPSCLWGVYNSDENMILQKCVIKEVDQVPTFFSLANSMFLVFHSFPLTLSIDCGKGKIDSEHFQGLKKVILDPFCFAENDYFRLVASAFVTEEHSVVKVDPVRLREEDFRFHEKANWEKIEDLQAQEGQIVHMPIEPPVSSTNDVWMYGLVGGLGTFSLLVLAAAFMFFRYGKGGRATLDQVSKLPSPPEEDVEDLRAPANTPV